MSMTCAPRRRNPSTKRLMSRRRNSARLAKTASYSNTRRAASGETSTFRRSDRAWSPLMTGCRKDQRIRSPLASTTFRPDAASYTPDRAVDAGVNGVYPIDVLPAYRLGSLNRIGPPRVSFSVVHTGLGRLAWRPVLFEPICGARADSLRDRVVIEIDVAPLSQPLAVLRLAGARHSQIRMKGGVHPLGQPLLPLTATSRFCVTECPGVSRR